MIEYKCDYCTKVILLEHMRNAISVTIHRAIYLNKKQGDVIANDFSLDICSGCLGEFTKNSEAFLKLIGK